MSQVIPADSSIFCVILIHANVYEGKSYNFCKIQGGSNFN